MGEMAQINYLWFEPHSNIFQNDKGGTASLFLCLEDCSGYDLGLICHFYFGKYPPEE